MAALAVLGSDDTVDPDQDNFSMRFRSSLRAVALAATAALALTACGGDEVIEAGALPVISAGNLTVCSDLPYPPFEVEDASAPSGYSGFDIDLMQAISDELGLTMVVKPLGFDPIQSGTAMNSNQCDVAASAMTITPEREENLDFTAAYFDADQSLLTTADSGVTTIADLDGKKVGVQSTTTGEAYANENATGAEVVSFEQPGDLLTAMQAGTVDAVIQDLPVNADFAKGDESFSIVETYPTGEQYGFAVAEEGKDELLEAINGALATLRSNGEYQKIYDAYFTA